MASGIVQYTLDTYIDPSLTTFYTNATATDAISAYITTPFTALATIAIIFTAIAIHQGTIEVAIKKLYLSMVTIVVIAIFALSASNFRTYIGNYLIKLPDEMMAVTASSAGSSITKVSGAIGAGEAIDKMFSQIYESASKAFKYAKWNDLAPFAYGGLFLVLGVFFVVIMAVAIIVVKVGVVIVVALGPLFILGMLFNTTREFFTKWLSFAIQFMVVGAILGLFIGLTLTITKSSFIALAAAPDFTSQIQAFIPFYIFLPVIAILFLMSTHFAASMTGGIATSIGGVMEWGVNKGMAGARSVGNHAGRRATRGWRETLEANRRVRIQNKVNIKTQTQ